MIIGLSKKPRICLGDKSLKNWNVISTPPEKLLFTRMICNGCLKISKDPLYKTGYDRNFWIWEKYQEGASYVLVADVARGDGADFSVFHIIRLDTMEVVAEYQGKPNLDLYANILNEAGRNTDIVFWLWKIMALESLFWKN